MKKLFLVIASACLLAPATLFAQEIKASEDETTRTLIEETMTPEGKIVTTTVYQKNSVMTNPFLHNWELMLDLGAGFYYGDNDWKVAKKTEMITFPAVDLYLTKWASPSFGVGLGATYSGFKGLYQSTPRGTFANANFATSTLYKDADSQYDYENLAVQKGSYLNVYALAHGDLGNIFFGYNPNRFFTIDAFAGGGVIFGFTENGTVPGATFNAGLANKFRLTDRASLLLNLRGALVSDDFDGENYALEPTKAHWIANHKVDGIFAATIGLACKLGKEKSKWNLASRTSTIYYNDAALAERDALKKALADANADNASLKDQLANSQKEVIVDVPEVWFHINFVVDRWDISKKELINIHAVADLIKSTPNTKYLVCGYADKQTATPAHNLMLSKNRVEAVYNALVNEFGVDPAQLVTDYKGGVDYMFYNDKELSRCAMITSIKE